MTDLIVGPDYAAWLVDLKSRIQRARSQAALAVNHELVHLYHHLGSEILARQNRQGWGAKVIDRLAVDLRAAFPDMRGLSASNLKCMRFFAELCPALQIGQQPADQLPWFHIVTLLTKVPDPDQREWYAIRAVERAWSRPTLQANIKAQLHLREGAAVTNFAQRLPEPQVQLAQEILKDPYHFPISWVLARRPTNGTSKTPWSATSPASCLSWGQGSPSSAVSSASKWLATSSSSTCFSISYASSATWWWN
jgi:predicted nuclease of restriction endonuclease-like (RecB) superfamily